MSTAIGRIYLASKRKKMISIKGRQGWQFGGKLNVRLSAEALLKPAVAE
jgi:hypothetical protein